MESKDKDFDEEDRRKILLWCARHCCLCGKDRGVDIEVAHIPGEEDSDELESAIPVCYDCHAKIGRYDDAHPLGTKFKPKELRDRRDQVYEQYTRHLVSSIVPSFWGYEGGLPKVGFTLTNSGQFPPVKAKVKLRVFLGDKELGGISDQHGYYSGETEWHLNPLTKIFGNFSVPQECATSKETLRIQIHLTAIDVYHRSHEYLPCCWQYQRWNNSWFLEPTSFEKLRARAREKGYAL
jgi:hypothetical protein